MIAVDTNLLVHAHQRQADLHQSAKEVMRRLAESPTPWAICFHCLVEFYAVVTHAALWRVPSTAEQALDQIAAWRASPSLRILIDSEDALDRIGEMAVAAHIRGGQIHDARIAACCLTYGVKELWTLDRDFSRYPELRTSNPLVI